MIWIYIAILLIILFFLFGYIREIYTPKYSPSKEIIRRVNKILEYPINVAIELLKEELKTAKITDKYYIYLNLAFLYMQSSKLEKALKLARSLIVGTYIDDNIKKRAIVLVGEIYLKLNRPKEGLEFLLEHKLEDKNYYFLIAKLYELLKDYKNAALYYKKIIDDLEKEQFSNIVSKLSILSSRNGDLETARSLITYASKIYENGTLTLAKGIYQFYSGNLERAIEFIKEGLNKNPNLYSFVRDELKEAYFEIGNFEGLFNYLKNLENPIAKLDYIRILVNMGEYERARDFFYENKEIFKSNLSLLSKAYQILKDDALIKDIIMLAVNSELYRCSACNSTFNSFYVECPNCYRIGTLNLIYQKTQKRVDETAPEILEEYIE